MGMIDNVGGSVQGTGGVIARTAENAAAAGNAWNAAVDDAKATGAGKTEPGQVIAGTDELANAEQGQASHASRHQAHRTWQSF